MKIRLVLVALIVVSLTALGQRTKLKPGINNYSPADDIKLGQKVAQDAEKSLTLVSDREVTTYVATLGQRLVSKAPNENKFPFTFKVVNEREINAFALPGGPVYVNRGAIEAADNEAQIAGVIGHEIAHVVHAIAMSVLRWAQPVMRRSTSDETAYSATPIAASRKSPANTIGTSKLPLAIIITVPMPWLDATVSLSTVPTKASVIAILSEANR